MTVTYNGPERRDLSECPLTAQQAYNMLTLLDQSIKQNQKMLEKQDEICERLEKLERCLFAGRIVFLVITSAGVLAAWLLGFLHDAKVFADDVSDFLRK